ncbi:MAG TPA: CapA family protein [Feifaniaceae bacterium]|nr:CapA family protein [Feifaniaceae bacterium]
MLACALSVVLLCGCAQPAFMEEPDAMEFPAPARPTQAPALTPSPTPVSEPTPTPEPLPVYAAVGAVGDIMMMQSQIGGAWNDALQGYDFTPSFYAMQPWFSQVDLLCGNLETPLAGEAAGYAGPAPGAPAPLPDGTPAERELQTFNAPDALATSLKNAGFDAITTANNHCLDRGSAGLFRTAQVLREAGLIQLGAYLSEEDRAAPRIIDVNGICVGLLAWTFSVNGYEGMLSSGERGYAVGRLDKTKMAEDIRLAREAGAEFLIAFPHWDTEYMEQPASSTKRLAQWMLEQGVDAVLGAHPHVVQPAEYMTVQRNGAEYTGLVAYSMGNFISNMSPAPKTYGMYVELTLVKTPEGVVSLHSAGILPLLCTKHRVQGRTLHEVLPALADASAVAPYGALSSQEYAELANARAHVQRVAGGTVPTLG